jgi:DNA-binding NtrC family response regulator
LLSSLVKASVLIIAPEGHWHSSLTAAIESYGYRVLVVPTAAIALGALRHIFFEILIGPFSSPTISGVDLGSQARLIQPHLQLVAIVDEPSAAGSYTEFDAVVAAPLTASALHTSLAGLVPGQIRRAS